MRFSKINLKISNSFFVSSIVCFFDLFEIFFASKLLNCDLPLRRNILENLCNSISQNLLNFYIKKLIQKNLLKFCQETKKMFLNLNFRKNFCKNLYQKRPNITSIKKEIFLPEFFLNKKTDPGDPLVSLLNIKKNSGKKTSLQLFLILKNFGLLDNDWNNWAIKISPLGLKTFLENKGNRLDEILKRVDSKREKFHKPSFSSIKGAFVNFERKIFSQVFSKSKRNINTWKSLYSSLDFFHRLEIEKNRTKIFHCFFFSKFQIIPFFHELGVCFFPCLFDKIFISSPSWKSDKKKLSKNLKNVKSARKKFQIIVESNYRIYVYKPEFFSSIIFELFSESFYQLPNLFVGEITEKSINKALKKGITSIEILNFLEKNLHEICLKLPKTICDQIKVWEFQKKKNIFQDSLVFRAWSIPLSGDIVKNFKVEKKIKFNKIKENLVLSKF